MPTYDYQCDACGHEFEKFQSITAPAVKKCPECGKLKVRRLIGTGAGVIFKGSGFYETDYRSESYKQAAKNDKPAAKSDSAGESTSKNSAKASGGESKSTSGKSKSSSQTSPGA
jgi:putative FmdB family regulatory protein